MPEIIVPFIFFAFLAAVILTPMVLKARARESGYKLIHEAMARGQQLDPKMIEQIVESKKDRDGPRWRRSLGAGVVLSALAAGLVGIGFADGYDSGPIKAAVILGAIGAGFILLAVIDMFTAQKQGEQ